MNLLAHSFLTFSEGQIVGQFLNDFIRNKDRFDYAEEIVQGIFLHRQIDTFTDSHPVIQEAKKVFSPMVRLYSGAFVDVCFDYFLANSLPEDLLERHAKKVYRVLNEHSAILPENMKRLLFHMEKDDWLFNYRTENGIKFSMQNVLNKAKYLEKDLSVFEVFLQNKPLLQQNFDDFFPELLTFANDVNESF